MSKIIPGIIDPTGLFVGAKQNGDVVDRNAVSVVEIYNNFTTSNPQKMMEEYKKILSRDFVYDEAATGMVYDTHEKFFTSLKEWKNCFSDSTFTLHRTTRNGNIVFHELTCTGTHDGLFNMPGYETTASGNVITTCCVMILEFNKDGKVKKCTNYFDTFGMMKAMGALPASRKD
mmetsp:Transcript_29925/g.43587  ORF Transcript_29925/g.43587 Transcript_29925/m.43587 type:complete len:174 (+) Transcript_29925:484-1005(+)